ncbi:hypothetical protein CH298_13470 [Rhodococcoides fascians]|uniref:glycine-rich domain-containing protein n=1 Tax=Rhodococcoides fascians TaxID=1828 RepID=UPI000B9A9100|nr:hypothetical protein [Rhodococcus fascians]OZE89986.1 hypothetical protein CH303_13350 [Rhodococcus fascians]OZF18293.1 hypothetical protein CH298_13470 [Rhodococcus fascians]OZF21744.1 hypothetical protein CH297_13365 [Rhodococcus fascians]OZF67369.1 hypothetical protein CH308_13265 [Rhodococcus fascians]OZF70559.1 hypothetical protein CH307_13460 [Rhodococcus fascians]
MGIAPDRPRPDVAYVGTTGDSGVKNVQNETQAKITAAQRAPLDAAYGDARNNMTNNLFGGFGNGIGGLLGVLVQGVFGIIGGGVGDFIGGLLGQRNKLDNVVNVEVPRLDNRIDQVDVGGGASAQRAYFGMDGTWTKPTGFSRHVVEIIGGGGGGGRSNGTQFGANGGGLGGYSGGWNDAEFFDGDLPATVAVALGNGGVGATADNTMGTGGGNSTFGAFLAAGGALSTAHGFGSKTLNIRGGNGGYVVSAGGFTVPYEPTAGTGHAFANGGAAGAGTSGAAGGNGNSPSPPTKPYPGTGGGGGARNAGTGNGGRGGNGGNPGAPGGGGGSYNIFGFAGNGGNGAPGACWITSYK